MNTSKWIQTRQAFTLLEIMIIVALIGLLVTLAIPSFIKGRKQAQGKRILNDARVIDAAVGAWALGQIRRMAILWTSLASLLT